jgi:hypothetical protein
MANRIMNMTAGPEEGSLNLIIARDFGSQRRDGQEPARTIDITNTFQPTDYEG